MSWLLRLIPEPWASVVLGAAIFVAWAYGDITGRGSERQKNEIARLEQLVAEKEREQQVALGIQTRMAESMAELRAAQQDREEKTDETIKTFRAQPGAPGFTDADIVQLRAIRIGRPRANPRRR